ncbi:hypothetical protein SAMN04488496_0988 [Streptococcus equinus]|nr:hypothetical protein SAMN04488496_0988 [Streptococcus equinus]
MNTDERLCKIDGVRQIKSPVEILFMSLETEKRVGNFEEIRFCCLTPAQLSKVIKADLSAY